MSIKSRCEVKRTIVLEFSLPGAQAHSSTHSGGSELQLKSNHNEAWSISVNQDNALETAGVFEELARAIRSSMV